MRDKRLKIAKHGRRRMRRQAGGYCSVMYLVEDGFTAKMCVQLEETMERWLVGCEPKAQGQVVCAVCDVTSGTRMASVAGG